MPIDDPPDRLYGLIVHELTHQFEFDIIPQGLIRRSVPLWVNEGLSDYERGQWEPLDLMTVRDAAVADIVPKMTELEGYGDAGNPRLIYNLGHAVFEFIEAKFGKEGIRQFLFALRKSVIGGGEDAYEEALRMKTDEFDQAFERYLKDRFKPFRDKERPADYGRDLSPNQEKTALHAGALDRAVALRRSDRGGHGQPQGQRARHRPDLVEGRLDRPQPDAAASTRTSASTTSCRWASIRRPCPWMAWSPKGDRLAYFVRTEKERTLIVQNVLTRKIEERIPMKSVDEPESPAFSPDGRSIAFSALRDGIGDIFTVDLDTRRSPTSPTTTSPTTAPTYSPDGKFIIYNARVSGNQKLFRLDLDTKKKTQLTFGTHDETAAQFIDDHTIVFSSTATDPAVPLEPEVAKNGNIYNIWTLDLTHRRAAAVHRRARRQLVADRAERRQDEPHRVRQLLQGRVRHPHARAEGAAAHRRHRPTSARPGRSSTSRRRCSTRSSRRTQRKKGTFEKMFLEGRPPVNVGVTNNGDVFGGTQVSFGDVLGDKQFNLFAASISQYRTLSLSYVNLSRRFQFALQGYSQTQFFYGQLGGLFYDPAFAPFLSRDDAIATRTVRGGSAFGIYPFNRYRRVELSGGLVQLNEEYNDPALQAYTDAYQQALYGTTVFRNGTLMPLGVAFVQETTIFREFGPLAGSTMRLAYDVAPKIGNTAVAPDLRRRRPPLPAARRQRPARDAHPRLQEHRRLPRLPCTSAATRRCAATTTCSSSARTSSSPTRSCASRSSRRR